MDEWMMMNGWMDPSMDEWMDPWRGQQKKQKNSQL
jgi:hypothetical protein